MADKTILQLTDIGQLEENDVLPIARVGEAADNSTTVGAIAEYVGNAAFAAYNTIIKLTSKSKPSRKDGSSSSSGNYKGYSVDVSELYGKGCVAVMFRGCNYSKTSELVDAIVPGLIFKEVASAQVVESYINNTSVPSTSVDWHILPITEDSKTLWATIGKSGTGDLAITPKCVIGLTQKELDAISAGENLENIYAELAKIGKIRYQGAITGYKFIVSKKTDPFPTGTIIENDSEMPISVYDEYNATYSDAEASGPAYIIEVGEQWVADVPVYQLRTRGAGNYDVMVHPKGTNSCDIKELDMRILPVSKMRNVPVNLKKPNLKVLDLGNSFTGDATDYLNALLRGTNGGANITTGFSLYKCVRGKSSFRTWVNLYKETDDANYNVSKVAGDTISGISTGDHSGLDNSWFISLLKNDWDIIIIHQYSAHSAKYDKWAGDGAAGGLVEYLRILRTYCPQTSIGFYLVHSRPDYITDTVQGADNSADRWQNIAKAVERLKADYGIDFIIPYGTAVQNLRMTSINPADGVDETKKNDFSDDGTHLNSSIGDYVAACTYFEALFAPRYNVTVLGNGYRKTTGFPDAGGHVQPVAISDDNALLAQRAAVLAVNDMFHLHNPEAEGFVPVNSDTKPVYTGDGSFNDVEWSEIKNKPTKVSDFTNDAGFITKSVDDLVNYYLKSETYTQEQVNNLLGAISQFHYEVYASRSEVTDPQNNVLYLIGPTGSGSDKYEEYVYPNSIHDWVKIGDTSIDLSGYVTTTALNEAFADSVHISSQVLSEIEKQVVRSNIGAASFNETQVLMSQLVDLRNKGYYIKDLGYMGLTMSAGETECAKKEYSGDSKVAWLLFTYGNTGAITTAMVHQEHGETTTIQTIFFNSNVSSRTITFTNSLKTVIESVSSWSRVTSYFGVQATNTDIILRLLNPLLKNSRGLYQLTLPAATTSSAGTMSATDKTKLDDIEASAQQNVQPDWNQTDSSADDYIKNKPINLVASTSVRTIVTLTQAQYDALTTKDANTEYNIIESV